MFAECFVVRFFPTLVIYFLAVNAPVHSNAMMLLQCVAVTSGPDGPQMCSTDQPTREVQMVGGSSQQCAVVCTAKSSNCVTFQYDQQQEQCQMYDTLSATWSVNGRCSAYFCSASPVPWKSVLAWVTVLSRVDTTFPTGLAADAYTTGFGDDNNFWIGVEKLYQVTNPAFNGGFTYKMSLELQKSSDSLWYTIQYDWFYLESSATKYVLRASTTGDFSSGTEDAINDSFSYTNGKPFYANSATSWCVHEYGPWWYDTPDEQCCMCRFFGTNANSAHGFMWGLNSDLLAVRMRVGPADD